VARTELDALRIVLVATRNPLNIGAAARAMSNFGFLHLRVVNPYEAPFREARSAVGASAVLAVAEEYKSLAEAIADCALVVGTTSVGTRQVQLPVRRLEDGAGLIRKRIRAGRVALLFGSEKTGLSNEDLSHCHWLMRIPTREEHRSMNLGQAVAVCLYELARSRRFSREAAAVAIEKPPTAGELERLTAMLLDALRASGYVKPHGARADEEKMRRMIRRMKMNRDDATLWIGMLRQMLWKMKKGE
jgi:TrmH family RNA methyltransferase